MVIMIKFNLSLDAGEWIYGQNMQFGPKTASSHSDKMEA